MAEFSKGRPNIENQVRASTYLRVKLTMRADRGEKTGIRTGRDLGGAQEQKTARNRMALFPKVGSEVLFVAEDLWVVRHGQAHDQPLRLLLRSPSSACRARSASCLVRPMLRPRPEDGADSDQGVPRLFEKVSVAYIGPVPALTPCSFLKRYCQSTHRCHRLPQSRIDGSSLPSERTAVCSKQC
jgi:hypothetical protein